MKIMFQVLVLTFVESMCCRLFFGAFLEKRFPEKKGINIFLIGFLSIASAFISILYNESYIMKSVLLLSLIAVVMGNYFVAGKIQIVFFSLAFYGILVAIDKIMLAVVEYTVPYDNMLQGSFKMIILALACKMVLFFCTMLLNRKFKKESSLYLISDMEWLRFLFFPLLTILSMMFFVVGKPEQVQEYILLASVVLIAGNFIVFYIIKDIAAKERKLQKVLIAQERSKNLTDLYIQMSQYNKEQKLKIHEFRHHITCIQGLLSSSQKEEAMSYMNQIETVWMEDVDYVNTGNAIVNAIVNQKYKLAKSKNIPLIMEMNNLRELPMQKEDVVTLAANLLDNAIEATELVESDKREIKFKMRYENGEFLLSIRNPTSKPLQRLGNRICTTKSEKQNHGIGIINVERVVLKYGGRFICSCREGYFTVTIVIKEI